MSESKEREVQKTKITRKPDNDRTQVQTKNIEWSRCLLRAKKVKRVMPISPLLVYIRKSLSHPVIIFTISNDARRQNPNLFGC